MGVRLIRGSRVVRGNDFSKKCLDLAKDFGILGFFIGESNGDP